MTEALASQGVLSASGGGVAARPGSQGVAVAPSLAAEVFHLRVCGARDEIPPMAFLVAVAALGLGWALRHLVPADELLAWLALQIGYAVISTWLALACRADSNRMVRARIWAFRFNAMAVVAGLLWAWVPVWLATLQQGLLQIVAGAILVGIPLLSALANRYFAAGQIGLVAVFLGSFVAYLGLVSDAPYHAELAVGCALYALAMGMMGVRSQSATVTLLTAQTQRERLIDQLQRAKEASDAANRAKSEFIANMSHELRTPLTVVLGVAQLLELSALGAEQRESVGLIERAGQALLSLVNHLLDLSSIDAGRLRLERVDFDLRETVEGVRRHLREEAESKGLAFTVRVAEDVPERVRGDELHLRQVLLNLCDNAVKFTPTGSVELSVDPFPAPAPNGRIVLRFTVSDTGIGMGKGAVASAFEPFFQVDAGAARRFGGAGLGLAISRRLVRLMGGTISVRSELGQGSTFTFTAAFEHAATGAGAARLRAPLEAGGRLPIKLLLVEDDPLNALVATSLLRTLVDEVDVVDSGEEALRTVQARAYDAIMMDCVLRGIDGYEAARRIRAHEQGSGRPRSYIVALTASVMAQDRERAVASGMDAFIAKPYRLEDLKEALLGAPAAVAALRA
ncbi:MAG TPA: ATP-binding protein [Burkholderiales bacterium]|nr:ATP-binding protein [Burkholderiales bacterium]